MLFEFACPDGAKHVDAMWQARQIHFHTAQTLAFDTQLQQVGVPMHGNLVVTVPTVQHPRMPAMDGLCLITLSPPQARLTR